jgi:hypothetical protein
MSCLSSPKFAPIPNNPENWIRIQSLNKLGDQRMKNKILSVSLLLAAGLFFSGRSARPANEKVSLESLNPVGVIEPPKNIGLTPRISDLAGKKIALLHNNKPGAANLYTALEVLLKQKYPNITVLRYYKPVPVTEPREEEFQKIAKECNAFIFAIGD